VGRTIGRLTALDVQRAKRRGVHHDGGGLYLQIAANGSKSWIFRYGPQGRRYHGLGAVHTITLAEAREKARDCRKLLLDGIDPITARAEHRAAARLDAAKAITFTEAATAYIKAHRAGWKNPKHRQQWTNTLATYVNPIVGHLPVAVIDTGLVLRCLEPVWTTKPETASRVRMRIERILAWATVRGYRAGDNPARWRGHLDHLLPAQKKVARVRHHAALPYVDLPVFLAELRARDAVAARALEFLILTATRTGEVIGATWDEFDLAAGIWTIPADRMKAGRGHRVPLANRAVKILEGMPRASRPFPLSNMAFLQLLKRMGRGAITAHGFRSAFRDWAAETTGYPNHVVEQALAHVIGNAVEAAYRRGDLFDKRRRLMNDWAAFCAFPGLGG
jgi:integrase